jgi:hypothetical protein
LEIIKLFCGIGGIGNDVTGGIYVAGFFEVEMIIVGKGTVKMLIDQTVVI